MKSHALVPAQRPTMSSLEIAELVEKRHDNVKRSIETLAERGVIARPQSEDKSTGGRRIKILCLGKRDSLVAVAQLSPEFTARVVDRWQELEERAQAGALAIPDFTSPAAAARAWADQVELAEARAAEIADMREDLEAHDRLTAAKGSLTVTEAAKALGICRGDLFDHLRDHRWAYRRNGDGPWLAYQRKCDQGELEHKVTTITRTDGSVKVSTQMRVTSRGLTRLAREVVSDGS